MCRIHISIKYWNVSSILSIFYFLFNFKLNSTSFFAYNHNYISTWAAWLAPKVVQLFFFFSRAPFAVYVHVEPKRKPHEIVNYNGNWNKLEQREKSCRKMRSFACNNSVAQFSRLQQIFRIYFVWIKLIFNEMRNWCVCQLFFLLLCCCLFTLSYLLLLSLSLPLSFPSSFLFIQLAFNCSCCKRGGAPCKNAAYAFNLQHAPSFISPRGGGGGVDGVC